ncbi:MAG: hypothetical protein KF868_10425 [Acidobacteria bacterium]|nr:hypothetical protein [Acidobacteriota bacterium]MCW5969900.1 hypothetical protein [Blastocatellales bacterium]
MDRGELLTRATVWIVLAGYALGAAGVALARNNHRLLSALRWAWTVGCIALVAHILCAYHYYHDWSQSSAWLETARQTAEVTGVYWGGGIYINYLFTLAWAADAAWWWRGHDAYINRPRAAVIALHAFLIFIVFNATVVFKTGVLRWVGLVLCIGLFAVWTRAMQRRRRGDSTSGIHR